MYKKIYLAGAFDRHNYGDILFPLIHSKILTSNGFKEENIKYAAVSASDMRNIGGYQTTSIKSMLSEAHDKNTLIVLCGGDILSADWLLMLGNLSTPLINKAFRSPTFWRNCCWVKRIFTHMSSAKKIRMHPLSIQQLAEQVSIGIRNTLKRL